LAATFSIWTKIHRSIERVDRKKWRPWSTYRYCESWTVKHIVFLIVCDTGWFVLVPYRCFSVIVISETFCISSDFFPVFYITLSYYLVYASLLSLLQLFFCLHVRLLYVMKYYLLTYSLTLLPFCR